MWSLRIWETEPVFHLGGTVRRRDVRIDDGVTRTFNTWRTRCGRYKIDESSWDAVDRISTNFEHREFGAQLRRDHAEQIGTICKWCLRREQQG